MDGWVKDARYALRTLVKVPGFTAVAVLTIALGVGANTAIFSVVRAVLLAPLPYGDSGALVMIWGEMRNRDVLYFPSSPPDFRDIRARADLMEDAAAVVTYQASLTGDEEDALQVNAAGVTPGFFGVLGVEPALGRGFVETDATPDEPGVQPGSPGSLPGMVILSHGLWQRRYGGERTVLGRTIQVSGVSAEVVGVMPPDFELLMPPEAALASDVDLWAALRIDYTTALRNNVFLRPVGRLRPGVSLEQAQAQIDRIAASLAADDRVKTTAGYGLRLEPLHEGVVRDVRPVVLALFGAVVFVLLIACANVANLLLVRAAGRGRELAVRMALGGSRRRLVRQLLLESGMLALLGALLGLVLAAGGISVLLALRPPGLPRLDDVGIDGTVLLFTAATAVASAFLFGLLPALQASSQPMAAALKERGVTGGRGRRLLRGGMVVGEVALSLVLLIGAGLMVRSFVSLTRASPGYVPDGLLTFDISLPFGKYPQPRSRAAVMDELRRRIGALPGVRSVSAGFPLPLAGQLFNGRYGLEEALTDPEAFRQAAYRAVLPGYFETMGTRVLAGRTFTEADYADSASVVVVDRRLAERLWPGEPAPGKRFLVRAITPEPEWVEVVGVVEHQRHESLASDGMETIFYTDRWMGSFAASWVVRARSDPLDLVDGVWSEVAAVDPDLPVADVRLFADDVAEAMGPTRFALTLIGVFGVIALVLATVGLYGVLSYLVRQRTAEIGVRMAFGAQAGSILELVVRQGLALAGAGIALGILAASLLTRVMMSLLVGVSPTDPATFLAIGTLFVLVAVLACWLPARRAARLDPTKALRIE